MSITVGFYDVFSYIIPGFLYLYVFYEAGKLLGVTAPLRIDIREGALLILILLSIGAYVIGQLMESLSYKFWYGLMYRPRIRETTLKEIKALYPDLNILFTPQQCDILHSVARQRDIEALNSIEKFEAYFVMLHNISFALLAYALLQIALMIKMALMIRSFSPMLICFTVVAVIFAVIAFTRSVKFRKAYYEGLYLNALNYGTRLTDVLENRDTISERQ